jgi:hypothetical protein
MFDLFMAGGVCETTDSVAADQSLDVEEHFLHQFVKSGVFFQIVRLLMFVMLLTDDLRGEPDVGHSAVHAAVRLHERGVDGQLWRGSRPYIVVFHGSKVLALNR